MITLTKSQTQILNQSLEILKNNNKLVITGKAGTGKTTLVKFLISELKNTISSRSVLSVCSAPTNKAVKVLKDKIGKILDNSFFTIHSALNLKRVISAKDGSISFKPDSTSKRDPLKKVHILIVDEASMINKEILTEIINKSRENPEMKIIFIGDEAQLPPVGEEFSAVFYSGFPCLELTEIIRQGEGNPIIDLSRDFSILKKRKDDRREIGGYIFSNDKSSVISTLAHVNGSDTLKYLSWTNQDVDNINRLVRESIYGTPAKIELGESLIFNTPYENYFTNDEIKVMVLDIVQNPVTAYRIYNPTYNEDNKEIPRFIENTKVLKYYIINNNIKIIHEDSEKVFEEMKKDMRRKCIERNASWKDYYLFVEKFADVKYNHAITVHKSQGSTYEKVIINIKNCMLNTDTNERDKLLYTAITRASNLVVLYNT